MKIPWLAALLSLSPITHLYAEPPAPQARQDGSGWTMVELDLDVWVLPGEQRMEMDGRLRLRLDAHESSTGPNLLLSIGLTKSGEIPLAFQEVLCEGAEIGPFTRVRSESIREAEIRFPTPKRRGEEIRVSFFASSSATASQLIVEERFALASWTRGWHPYTNSTPNARFTFHAGLLAVPGRTTLHLPADWSGLVDGSLVERERRIDETVEVWSTPPGIARGFAAGPYAVATERVDGRDIHVYMSSTDKPIGPKRLSRLIADSVVAQSARFGEFPFESYAVVETPDDVRDQSWSAASQQSFIVARSHNFDHEDGNLPLWGHEMAHAWWGNTVATRGPGSLWCDESLAQLGALVTIEAAAGPESMREFLEFSQGSFGPLPCAAGYFARLRGGLDSPISTATGGGRDADIIADSKGMWVYHMLRHRLGDERFFQVLRSAVVDLGRGFLSTKEMRRRFLEAAPEQDLGTFFSQWLDRTGAPVLDVDWYATSRGDGIVLEIEQLQAGAPFVFELEVEILLDDGRRLLEVLSILEAQHAFVLDTRSRPVDLELDPQRKVLLWRPEYGPRPGSRLPVAGEIIAAVVGRYGERGSGQEVEILEREGALFLRTEGSPELRLLHRDGGVFDVDCPGDPIVVTFDLSESRAPSLEVVDSTGVSVAIRIDDPVGDPGDS